MLLHINAIRATYYFFFFFTFYLLILERARRRERKRWREKNWLVVLPNYAFTGWFLYVPWPGIKPLTLAYGDNALINLVPDKDLVHLLFFPFLIYFIDYAITIVPFSPLYSPPHCTPPSTCIPPPLSSCPWVIHISSLASTFPILTFSLSIFYLPFMLLILCTFSRSLPLPLPCW